MSFSYFANFFKFGFKSLKINVIHLWFGVLGPINKENKTTTEKHQIDVYVYLSFSFLLKT